MPLEPVADDVAEVETDDEAEEEMEQTAPRTGSRLLRFQEMPPSIVKRAAGVRPFFL
jgi:nitrous oxide reductase accessory protein NosL